MSFKNIFIPTILFAVIYIFGITIYEYIQKTKPPILPNIDNNRAMDVRAQEKRELYDSLPHISLDQARGQLYTLFVDIRTLDAYKDKRITGSVHITDFVPKDHTTIKNIILVHAGGEQSSQFLHKISTNIPDQFKATILRGGFPVWDAASLPMIKRADIENIADIAKVQLVEPRDLDALLADTTEEIFILDIRSTTAFARGHIPSAYNIPLAQIEKRKREIPRRTNIYVYGREFLESFEGGALLFDLGRINAHTLNDGFTAWQKFGYSVEK